MVGLDSRMREGPIGPSPSGSRRRARPLAVALRSAPAQKVPLAPHSTATRAAASASNARNASASAAAVSRSTAAALADARSEEHTSELQSRFDLVCRLL